MDNCLDSSTEMESTECALYALKDGESPISILTHDCAKVIFSKLEREAVQKLRRTCKFMEDTFQQHRAIIPGPICNINVFYNDGMLSLYIGSTTEDRPQRLVPLDDWYMTFKNAKCNFMYLNCDRELPDDIWRKIICCDSINRAEYVGKRINQNVLDGFAPLIVESLQVVVDHWNPQLIGFPKFKWLMIDCEINDLTDIIEVAKTVSAIEVPMNYGRFVNSIPSLLSLCGQTTCLPHWSFEFRGHPSQDRIVLDISNLEQTLTKIYGNLIECANVLNISLKMFLKILIILYSVKLFLCQICDHNKHPNITESCECLDSKYEFGEHCNTIIIKSPSFQNISCPRISCNFVMNYPQKQNEYIMVESRSNLSKSYSMKSLYRNTYHFPLNMPFDLIVLDSSNLSFIYNKEEYEMNTFFEINLTRIHIPEECKCSTFNDKIYNGDDEILLNIPLHCEVVLCYWRIDYLYRYREDYNIKLHIAASDLDENDVLLLNDWVSKYSYNNTVLKNERDFETSENQLNIAFHRFHNSKNLPTRITMKWYANAKNESKVLTSSGYPNTHCASQDCWTTITSPNGSYIEVFINDLSLENMHDYLKIYDGSKTGKGLAELTGNLANEKFKSSRNIVTLHFRTDRNNNRKGFHLNVKTKFYKTAETTSNQFELYFIGIISIFILLIICIFSQILNRKFQKPACRKNGVVNYTVSSGLSEIEITRLRRD
ncbi:unnamed protein product [Caenorhabditis angaria]|uniref:CUB domain-containing protein n=1 Tax=Caenorhabditis angaria TaxID=860376 RepID=A0A9P1J2C2_9PELO|nr:unnamed protein product [Caenorhabditis angaria]